MSRGEAGPHHDKQVKGLLLPLPCCAADARLFMVASRGLSVLNRQAQGTLGTNLTAFPVFKNILKYGQEEVLALVTINR